MQTATEREQGTATVEVDGIDYWVAIVDRGAERCVYLMRAETDTGRGERMLHAHREPVPAPRDEDAPACPVCGSAELDCEPGCEAVPARVEGT